MGANTLRPLGCKPGRLKALIALFKRPVQRIPDIIIMQQASSPIMVSAAICKPGSPPTWGQQHRAGGQRVCSPATSTPLQLRP